MNPPVVYYNGASGLDLQYGHEDCVNFAGGKCMCFLEYGLCLLWGDMYEPILVQHLP